MLVAVNNQTNVPYYSNGPKPKILRVESVRTKDNKVLGTLPIENGWLDIDTEKKIIKIYNSPTVVDKYYYNEFNKNISAKGIFIDMFSIKKVETSLGYEDKIEVLVFRKNLKTDELESIWMVNKKSCYVIRFL